MLDLGIVDGWAIFKKTGRSRQSFRLTSKYGSFVEVCAVLPDI